MVQTILSMSPIAAGAWGSKQIDVGIQPPPPNTPEGIPITLAFLPMYHTYGLHLFVIRAFMSQNTLVFLPKWDIELALNVISKSVAGPFIKVVMRYYYLFLLGITSRLFPWFPPLLTRLSTTCKPTRVILALSRTSGAVRRICRFS